MSTPYRYGSISLQMNRTPDEYAVQSADESSAGSTAPHAGPAAASEELQNTYTCCKLGTSRVLTIAFLVLLCTVLKLGLLDHFRSVVLYLTLLPGPLSSAIMGLLIFGACMVPLPVSLFQVAAGYLFGWSAIPLVIVFTNLGSWSAYGLCKHLLETDGGGSRVEALTRRNEWIPQAARLWIRVIADGASGPQSLLIVTASRPCPLPLSLQNCVLSLAPGLDFWGVFVPGTLMGLFPENVLYPYIGRLVRHAGHNLSGDAEDARWVVLMVEVVMVAILVLIISATVRATFKKQIELAKLREEEASTNSMVLAAEIKSAHAQRPVLLPV